MTIDNGNMPASPISVSVSDLGDTLTSESYKGGAGLSKREHFAAKALQGLLVNVGRNGFTPDNVADEADRQACNLLKALEQTALEEKGNE